MHHFVIEMCTRVHISVTKWCIVGYLPDAWWDLWDGSFGGHAHTALAALIHHDLQKLQEMLDVTNHVANKYHIQFGAAKCKVVRKGKGRKSTLKLNGEVLEEVPSYKYLGEIINSKGNLSDHIAEVARKIIKGATTRIIAEAGNK